ncbi:MAG: ParB/RepB/Spo0J family partition protein [Nitratireductor sp.]|nr:ParB/RepB/Spo0J family partition protein [Nitratireductor sp.]
MTEDNSKKRLGRGLAALIGELDQPAPAVREASETRSDRRIPIEHIRANPSNPRRHFNEEELADLTRSITEHGIVQPILVRPVRGGDLGGAKFEIIAGERRWRAAQRAGLHEVPVILRNVEDKQALELAIIENVQRSDLNAIEEAQGYQQLIDEYDYSQNELATVIGKSRSHVANTLRLMKLPENVRVMVSEGVLSAGHARTLVTAAAPEQLAQKIVRDGLSVRQAEALAQQVEDPATRKVGGTGSAVRDADLEALERRLGDMLGLKISISDNGKGGGDLKIRYRTLEQLDAVCRKLESGI